MAQATEFKTYQTSDGWGTELDMSWVTEEQVVPDDYKETRDFEHFEI